VVRVWRAVLAGATVILGAVCGVVTALVTAHPSRGLWAGLGVTVVAGALWQAAVTYGERRERSRVEASGAGAVAVGGSTRGEVRTRVRGKGTQPAAAASAQGGVISSGPGSVSVGGDAGPVSTDVMGQPEQGTDEAGTA
jgi:hypothetical protein